MFRSRPTSRRAAPRLAYTYTQPCEGARGVNGARLLLADTDAWSSGPHVVTVRAIDAGGETRDITAGVHVDHDPPGNVRFTGLPRNLRVIAGRKLEFFDATAEDPHSGLKSIELQWRDVERDVWRRYAVGSEPVARLGHRYQLRARATDELANVSDWAYSPGLLAVRGSSVRLAARLHDGVLLLSGRVPKGRALRLGLRLGPVGGSSRRIGGVRVRGRFRRRVPLPVVLRDLASGRLTIRYRSADRMRARSLRIGDSRRMLRLPL